MFMVVDIALHIHTNFHGHYTAKVSYCRFSLYINSLPEAICCCLQSCCVGMLLLLMGYMCIPSFNGINTLAASLHT